MAAQEVVPGEDEALAAVTSPRFDGERVAVVEDALDGLQDRAPDARAGRAEITDYEPDRVEVTAEARGEGLLVLGDIYYPGWKASVDGDDVPIERVDYLLRGVRIEPGNPRRRVPLRARQLARRMGAQPARSS